MTLTNRLSAAFLGAIALILVGFSAALYVLASTSLYRSVDDRLEGALHTLASLVEDETDGLDWERDGRPLAIGLESGHDEVRWLIRDDRGDEVDRSRNLGDSAVLAEPAARRHDAKREPWRVVQRRIDSARGVAPAPPGSSRSASLILAVGLPLEPVDRPLRRLALTLGLLSLGIWGLTALIGRRLCRTALAPLASMAAEAKGLGAAEPGRRLAVAETGDELHELALSFNALLGRWHEALERQSRFAGDASHQLRTPLTALIGQVDVALRRERSTEDYRDVLARVRDQADRLRRIIEALLFLARSDHDAGLPTLETFDLATWADDQLQRRSAERREGPGRLDGPRDRPILVQSHLELLAEVVDNLVDNAVHHGRGPTPPSVRVSIRDGWAVLAVEDQGPGIAPGELGRIFEPFYRSVVARKATPRGVGLGLAVASRIVRSLGGRLEVESAVGQGTRFFLFLPLASPDASTGGDMVLKATRQPAVEVV